MALINASPSLFIIVLILSFCVISSVAKKQGGAVPFKGSLSKPDEIQVMLITNDKGNWVFPKGTIESGEDGEGAAKREAEEEAGVKGKIGAYIGTVENADKDSIKFYTFSVSEELSKKKWKESGDRERAWYSLADAEKTAHAYAQEVVSIFVKYVNSL